MIASGGRGRWRGTARMATGLAVLAWVSGGAGSAPTPSPFPLSLTEPDSGRTVRVDPGADPLHLVFFATWCPPCVDELGALARVESRWKGSGYRLVIVAVATRQSRERIRAFTRGMAVPGRLLFDADGSAQSELSVEDLPAHLLVDPGGVVVLRASSLSSARDGIERILADREGR